MQSIAMTIAGLIPAAGSSSRLGRDKLLVELAGEPLIRRAARVALAARLDPVIVVAGPEQGPLGCALERLPVTIVTNPRHAEGMASSVHAGIAAVPPACEGALVLLPDMPLVTAELLIELTERFAAERPPLVVTLYGDTAAPPTLYARSLFGALRSAEAGGRQVVREHRTEAAIVRRPASLLVDVDLPADLDRLRRLLGEA